jgi:hypothetical protein
VSRAVHQGSYILVDGINVCRQSASWALPHHHHQITKLSHSINAMGLACAHPDVLLLFALQVNGFMDIIM